MSQEPVNYEQVMACMATRLHITPDQAWSIRLDDVQALFRYWNPDDKPRHRATQAEIEAVGRMHGA